jgi:hypothetical protein
VEKRPRGAPGIYELEPGLFKVVVSLGRDGTGRYRQQARTRSPRGAWMRCNEGALHSVDIVVDGFAFSFEDWTAEQLLDGVFRAHESVEYRRVATTLRSLKRRATAAEAAGGREVIETLVAIIRSEV